ncbi:unnamed protein product [Orchesella dallaii]|uniref:Uncharacterized protein n=1 Tax=Orchesella dallaii TaxID=48710 RepID=A0ABP1RW15_9HEXA
MCGIHFLKHRFHKILAFTYGLLLVPVLNVPFKFSLSAAAEIDINVDGILKGINDTENCLIHIISQSVRFYFKLPLAASSTYSVRQYRRVENLHNSSDESWDNDANIFLRDNLIKRDNENPPVTFNPSQMKRAPTCIYAILLFAFNEIEIKMSSEWFSTRTYTPYSLALNELKQFYNFYWMEKRYKVHMLSEPPLLLTIHVSFGSQRLRDELRIETHQTLHYLNIHTGILDCVDISIASVKELSNCNATYLCIHCVVPWQFLSVNSSTLLNVTTFRSFSKLVGTPKLWTLITMRKMESINLKNQLKNPFILSSKQQNAPFQFSILSILLSESNSSIALVTLWSREYHGLNEIFAEKRMSLDYQLDFTGNYEGDFRQDQFWQTSVVSSEGYNFITCYSTDRLKFSYYFEPFQIELWIALLVYLPILSVLTHLLLVIKKCNKSDFNAYFFAYSSMIEYCYYVPDYLFRMHSVRIVLGLWLLISCIFTNAYKGLAITGVTAPPEKTSVKTMAELVDDNFDVMDYNDSDFDAGVYRFKILTSLTVEYLDAWKTGEWDVNSYINTYKTDVDLIEVDGVEYFPFAVESQNEFFKLMSKMKERLVVWYNDMSPLESFQKNDRPHIRALRLYERLSSFMRYFVPKREVEPPQFSKSYEIAIERELVGGDEQIAYIDYEEKVKREHDYLTGHYHHKTFFIGNQSFLKEWTVWQFDNGRGSRLPAIFQLLVENGIYNQLKSFYENIEFFGVRNEYTRIQAFKTKYERVKKLNLQSNLQTVFYMFLSGILISILGLGTEAFNKFIREVMTYLRFRWRNYLLGRITPRLNLKSTKFLDNVELEYRNYNYCV